MKCYLQIPMMMMMMMVLSSISKANGSIEIIGRGEMGSPPEFAEISATVTSICYESSREAKSANAALATEIVSIFKKQVRSTKDKVIATGGPNSRQTEYVYSPGGATRVLCERKWRASNQIRLEVKDWSILPDVQDEVLAAVDKDAPDPGRTAQSYAELSQPGFRLYPETMVKLRKEAQGLAWNDAKSQLDAFKSGCSFKNLRLTKVFEPMFVTHAKFGDVPSEAMNTPLIPDSLTIRAVWKFVWEFDPTPACAR